MTRTPSRTIATRNTVHTMTFVRSLHGPDRTIFLATCLNRLDKEEEGLTLSRLPI